MKLNAAALMQPLSLAGFQMMHPFAPADQAEGYMELIAELEKDLATITGFAACSLQPNSGAAGEYSGLMVIRAYHQSRGQGYRNVVLIPASAHGTNPASAAMAGMKIVTVACDANGNIDVADLEAKAKEHASELCGLMVTYPSTHGVFESRIREIVDAVHDAGGQVYMDGANMNAQVGLTNPGYIGADVCHLNLHKTFAMPHGGGGPGVGPICVAEHLKAFLPTHPIVATGGEEGITAVSSAPWGSAMLLPITYGYIKMLGEEGLRHATEMAIVNANYMSSALKSEYRTYYSGETGRVGHEMILDLTHFKKEYNIDCGDIAHRLMDYGFHAPTLSFPVHETLMVEPTESEPKEEMDRFIEALVRIKRECEAAVGEADNVVVNAPHTAVELAGEWGHPYSRMEAAFPLEWVRHAKFFPLCNQDRQRLRRPQPLLPQLRVTPACGREQNPEAGTGVPVPAFSFPEAPHAPDGTIISGDYLATRPEVLIFVGICPPAPVCREREAGGQYTETQQQNRTYTYESRKEQNGRCGLQAHRRRTDRGPVASGTTPRIHLRHGHAAPEVRGGHRRQGARREGSLHARAQGRLRRADRRGDRGPAEEHLHGGRQAGRGHPLRRQPGAHERRPGQPHDGHRQGGRRIDREDGLQPPDGGQDAQLRRRGGFGARRVDYWPVRTSGGNIVTRYVSIVFRCDLSQIMVIYGYLTLN